MKYVALLSGGKDSCFNLLHCHINGHHLVAAASLRPPDGQEEIDSFMYQSVGQDAIELVAKALDVPLFRGFINGKAVDQSLAYDGNGDDVGEGEDIQEDETEDLFRLLQEVKVVSLPFPLISTE
jgi:diphthine-ammonia ligase